MKVHLVNPRDHSFGTVVITPRWLFVLAAATPQSAGDPVLTDESLEPVDPERIEAGDMVGICVHTGNTLRGYQVGRMARARRLGGPWRHPRHPAPCWLIPSEGCPKMFTPHPTMSADEIRDRTQLVWDRFYT
jgi:hypothetical protein